MNTLYYGDNLDIFRRYIKDESVDFVYLDPPFESNQNYNVLFQELDGTRSKARWFRVATKNITVLFLAAALCWSAERPRGVWARGARIQASPAFRAVGVYWRDSSKTVIRARGSLDGRRWTPWLESHGELLNGDRMASGLIYFGEDCRSVEVEGVDDPEVLLIDPGAFPAPSREVSAHEPAPPLVTREQWGCTPQTCPAKDSPQYTTVTHLIVHHTDNLNSATDWAAVVRAIWVLHVQGNGWNDIGYNYLVDPDGLLYEGRAGGDGVLGAHFSGVNSGTMGVALLGTYIDAPPSAAMLDTLEAMLAWQSKKWQLDPIGERLHAASGLILNVIGGHRDAGISPKASSTTECPGNTAYSLLPRIRQDVFARTAPCVISVGERNLCAPSEGASFPLNMQLHASNCQGPVNITPSADWITGGLNVAPNRGPRRNAAVDIGGREITITQSGATEGPLPCIARSGVVNGADFGSRPVVAGSQMAIFGQNFGQATAVTVNGKTLELEYAGASQINVQLPTSVKIGTNHLSVTAGGIIGPEANFWLTEAMPAIFIAVNFDDNALNGPQTPVKAGRPLTVYLTGVGAVDNSVLHNAISPWTAALGGKPAGKLFLGLAPLFAGVYQANIVVPDGLAPGDYPLEFTVKGVVSAPATISVGN